VQELVRKHSRFFLTAMAAGFALRLIFIFFFARLTNDSYIYGDIAKNWLQHGVYALSDAGGFSPTYIRLPGYPAFLAAMFWIFGMEHYRAVLIVQMFVDIGACFLIADLARRLVSDRAARAAFLLAALCPFLADYVSAPLSETLEVFFTALALDLALVGLAQLNPKRMLPWVGCGLAVGMAILLRPDGGLLLAAIELYLAVIVVREGAKGSRARMRVPTRNFAAWFKAIFVVGFCALILLIPWTVRNLRTLHRFQPLAPRYANASDEYVPAGFNRWVKTWIADYSSTEAIYWNVPGSAIDSSLLPNRAFDSPQQREQTLQLIDDYNQSQEIAPALDSRFAALAAQCVNASPTRYYIWLPTLRIADMWLRPRTEKLPCNSRWWEFDEDPQWMALMIALGVINLAYIGAAAAGLARNTFIGPIGILLLFTVLRSLFLGTLENPEARYTLECYPVVIVLASALTGRFIGRADLESTSKK
jgi:4-amino-4-deoxy-L-arabinose transferase-like glycosyltransferase